MSVESVNTAVNIGTIGIVGTILGMPVEALVIGTVAGVLSNGLRESTSLRKGMFSIVTSALMAGAFTPVISTWLAAKVGISGSALSTAISFGIGAAWPNAVPLLSDGLTKIWGAIVAKGISFFGGGNGGGNDNQ